MSAPIQHALRSARLIKEHFFLWLIFALVCEKKCKHFHINIFLGRVCIISYAPRDSFFLFFFPTCTRELLFATSIGTFWQMVCNSRGKLLTFWTLIFLPVRSFVPKHVLLCDESLFINFAFKLFRLVNYSFLIK